MWSDGYCELGWCFFSSLSFVMLNTPPLSRQKKQSFEVRPLSHPEELSNSPYTLSAALAKPRHHVHSCSFLTLPSYCSRYVQIPTRLMHLVDTDSPFQELQSMNIAARLYTTSSGRIRD